ncbi:MAG: ATP-binding protein [Rhodomicrobium sp.]
MLRSRVGKVWRFERLEFSQILTRYAIGVVITAYAILDPALETQVSSSPGSIAILLVVAWIIGFGLLLHLLIWPHRHILRRMVSIFADALALSLVIHYGERSAAIFFPVYLWVILGNGFRFGIAYMYVSMAVNGICFIIMVLATPYWRQEWQFSAGLLIAIIAIPIYCSSLIRKLRASMKQATAASTAKTEFLSMISHELRTPLNAILGLAQISKITATTAQERENAASTEIAAHRLTRMLDSILKFQAVESGARRVRERPFNVIETLSEVESIVAPLASKKRLKLQFVFRTALPREIRSDPDIIQTIILNLVTNAIKYTKRGAIIVEVAFLNKQGRMTLHIEVHDSGPGIDPDMQDRIFDEFVRLAPNGTEDEGGVGLGLSLCKSLTGLLGGSIDCISARGKGSTFRVDIPAEPFEAAQSQIGQDIKIVTFGLDHLALAGAGPEFTVLQSCEEGALTARDEPCGPSAEELVVTADPSQMASADWEGLSRLPDHSPLIAVSPGSDTSNEFSARATAIVPSAGDLSPELIRTVAHWHRRHLPCVSENLKPSASREKTVLVADDNLMNRQVIARMLQLDGYMVVEAQTGEDALEHLLTEEIDVAILDVNMPDQDGTEVCKTYQSVTAKETAAVIAGLTADISEETRSRCLEAGMFDVLSKPLDLEDLRSFLSRSIGDPSEATPSTLREAHEEEVPVLDNERLSFLIELFGVEAFKNNLLTTFETELRANIERLKAEVPFLHFGYSQAVLHAIKSSAKTIGALRLVKLVSTAENSPLLFEEAGSYEAIANELNTFMVSCKKALKGHEKVD